ncbi:hypothetical protein HW35_13840 [Bacillus sp. X1(2014)]|nr:hypothetical protein HW35_13840 [Bacillus sp. X1(2014)]
MGNFIIKLFSFKDLKYGWLLSVSFVIFTLTLFFDLYIEPAYVQLPSLAGYGIAFIIASLWGSVNYIGHIKINALYQKSNDIHAFVNQLAINDEERQELQAYLEDFVQDLVSHGETKEEATKKAIEQFKIKEFTSLSKNTMLFNLPAHYYLGGFALVSLSVGLLLRVLYIIFPSLFLLVLASSLFAYGVGFMGLFFVYKIIDAIIYKKLTVN